MKSLKILLLSLPLLWSGLPACGDNLVGFPLGDASAIDAPPNDGRLPDGSTDGATDASTDATAIRPTVIATIPLNNAINVSVNKVITATFSVAMNPATLTGLTFIVKHAGVGVPGVVTYVGASNTAVFTPNAPLTIAFVYQATITTGAAMADHLRVQPIEIDHLSSRPDPHLRRGMNALDPSHQRAAAIPVDAARRECQELLAWWRADTQPQVIEKTGLVTLRSW